MKGVISNILIKLKMKKKPKKPNVKKVIATSFYGHHEWTGVFLFNIEEPLERIKTSIYNHTVFRHRIYDYGKGKEMGFTQNSCKEIVHNGALPPKGQYIELSVDKIGIIEDRFNGL